MCEKNVEGQKTAHFSSCEPSKAYCPAEVRPALKCCLKRKALIAHTVCANFGLNAHTVCTNFGLIVHTPVYSAILLK